MFPERPSFYYLFHTNNNVSRTGTEGNLHIHGGHCHTPNPKNVSEFFPKSLDTKSLPFGHRMDTLCY